MKKSWLLLAGTLVLAGGAVWYAAVPTGVGLAGALGGGDRQFVAERSYDFLEDLRYKDFKKASSYHLPATQAARDIPEMIRRRFGIKHEVLDIHSFKILGVDFDRSENRARVRSMVYYRVLSDVVVRDHVENNRDAEMLFYWFKQADGQWVMELESSL